MTITDEQLDQIEQALVKAALNGSAPAARWVLANRRPGEWALKPAPASAVDNNLAQALVDVLDKAEGRDNDDTEAEDTDFWF